MSVMNESARWAIIGSLLYASYMTYSCPCDLPVACKQSTFYAATLAPVLLVVAMNA